MIPENYAIRETHLVELFTVEFWTNGIVHVTVPGDTTVDVKQIKAQYEFLKTHYDQKNKFLVLVEGGYDSTLTKEAREFSALPETNAMTSATAVVVKSLAERLIINFLINIASRNDTNIRLFDSSEEAVNWLLSSKEVTSPKPERQRKVYF